MSDLLRCRACGRLFPCGEARTEDECRAVGLDIVGGFALCPCANGDVQAPGFTCVEVCGEWCEVPAPVAVNYAPTYQPGQLDLFAEAT